MLREVREGVVERDERAVCLGYRRDRDLQLAVERVQLPAVRRDVGVIGGLAVRVELGQLRGDRGQVVLLDESRIQPEMRVLLAVHRQNRDPVAEDEVGRLAATARGEKSIEKVVQPDSVRHDQLGVGQLLRVVGLWLVVLGADARRDDRGGGHARSPDVLDDVREDGRRGDHLEGARPGRRPGGTGGGRGRRCGLAAGERKGQSHDRDRAYRWNATESHCWAHVGFSMFSGN